MATKATALKLTAAQAREKVVELQNKLDNYNKTAQCPMCRKHKDVKIGFYIWTQTQFLAGIVLVEYAVTVQGKIALRVDKMELSMIQLKNLHKKALYYLNKPLLSHCGIQVYKSLKI